MMTLTPAMFGRTVVDFRSAAKENGRVRWLSGGCYFFGSEVATLRLLALHRFAKHARQGYSVSQKSFYFSLDLPNFTAGDAEFECLPEKGWQYIPAA